MFFTEAAAATVRLSREKRADTLVIATTTPTGVGVCASRMRRSEDSLPRPGERLERLTTACEEKCVKIVELKEQVAYLESMIREFGDHADSDANTSNLQLNLAKIRCSISPSSFVLKFSLH
jgi:hypothetical protein